MGIAMMTKMDHWALDEQEADAMAKSVVNVARHYPKVASSQKLIDWTMLIGAIGMAYVPRVMMTREVLAKRNQPRTEDQYADRMAAAT
jgi:hypothetical protein